jgi:prepilin-type N-terminal cleavage/methylation domain-containing protein
MPAGHFTARGFTLVELLIALVLAAGITTGTVRLVSAASASYRAQQNLGALQENARFAFEALRREVAQAGFRPEPWNPAYALTAVASESADAYRPRSDLLVLQRWSRRNCFENANPINDADGPPAYHLLENAFHVTAAGALSQRCRYGPDATRLTTQINGLGLVNDVSGMQLLFAEDGDQDGNADRWVRAGAWQAEAGVLGTRIGLLLATPEAMHAPPQPAIPVLDETLDAPPDGRLYRFFETTVALAGRQP